MPTAFVRITPSIPNEMGEPHKGFKHEKRNQDGFMAEKQSEP